MLSSESFFHLGMVSLCLACPQEAEVHLSCTPLRELLSSCGQDMFLAVLGTVSCSVSETVRSADGHSGRFLSFKQDPKMESTISLPCLSESVKLQGSPVGTSRAGCWSTTVSALSASSKPLECEAHRLPGALFSALGQVRAGMSLGLPEPPPCQLLSPPHSPA